MFTSFIRFSLIKRNLLALFLCSVTLTGATQNTWQLKKERDGIQVYTRGVDGSRVKQVKVKCFIDATLSQLFALVMDAPAHERWVYNTKRSYVLHQLTASHQVYYSETSLPWPMSNRDVVVDMIVLQDPHTKVMQIQSHSVDTLLPAQKGIVRVPMSQVHWVITPKADRGVLVEYTAQADPGGSMPAWLVNAFVTKGPLETFVKLKELIKKDAYQLAQYAFIIN